MKLLNKHVIAAVASLCLAAGFAGSALARERICLTTADGNEVCFWIPILIDQQWFDPNPPDPRTPVFDPHLIDLVTGVEGPLPDPWSTDLVIISNISVLAQGLSEGRREALMSLLLETQKSLTAELPAGARIVGP